MTVVVHRWLLFCTAQRSDLAAWLMDGYPLECLLLDVLLCCRSQEVMHRDLKPENLLLDDQVGDCTLTALHVVARAILASMHCSQPLSACIDHGRPWHVLVGISTVQMEIGWRNGWHYFGLMFIFSGLWFPSPLPLVCCCCVQGHLKLIDFGSAKALFLPPTVRLSGNHR